MNCLLPLVVSCSLSLQGPCRIGRDCPSPSPPPRNPKSHLTPCVRQHQVSGTWTNLTRNAGIDRRRSDKTLRKHLVCVRLEPICASISRVCNSIRTYHPPTPRNPKPSPNPCVRQHQIIKSVCHELTSRIMPESIGDLAASLFGCPQAQILVDLRETLADEARYFGCWIASDFGCWLAEIWLLNGAFLDNRSVTPRRPPLTMGTIPRYSDPITCLNMFWSTELSLRLQREAHSWTKLNSRHSLVHFLRQLDSTCILPALANRHCPFLEVPIN